jgi:uncharacterized protein (UPF0261 family)
MAIAGDGPASFEAAAVVGQDSLHADAVPVVEADELVEERDRAVCGFVGINGSEAEPGAVVDRDEQVLPAGLPFLLASAVAGDAVARLQDPAQLLDVDVDSARRVRRTRSGSPLPAAAG